MISPNNEDVKLWLELSEGSGTTANDSSGEGNNGSINSASWVKVRDGGYALSFDGSDDYVTLPTTSAVWRGVNTFSVNLWFKAPKDSTTGYIIHDWQWTTGHNASFFLSKESSNDLRFGLTNDGYNTGAVLLLADESSWNADEWNMVTTVEDNGSMKIYVNSILVNTATITGNNSSPVQNVYYLGVYNTGSALNNYFNGSLRLPITINKALTAEEIKQLYQQTYISEE